jgi:hypothetical protein
MVGVGIPVPILIVPVFGCLIVAVSKLVFGLILVLPCF